jgi:tRNA pseudouridine55 synthase
VHSIDLLGMAGDALTLRVHCGKGLYVRTLAEDIGAALGCGAHLAALRREAVGPFSIADAIRLDDLAGLEPPARDARLLPVDVMTRDLSRLELGQEAAWQLGHGQAVWLPGLSAGDMLSAYGPAGDFLGVVEVDADGKAAPRRLVAT